MRLRDYCSLVNNTAVLVVTPSFHSDMRFILKVTIIILTARVLAGSPRGGSREVDAIGDLTVRDMARGISSAFDKVETAVVNWWQKPAGDKEEHPQPRRPTRSRS